MLLELIQELGISPLKSSATNGGEFHCPCPNCGGKDRFVIWPERGRYWCRRCEKSGDSIQFCRDFFNLDFKEACKKAQQEMLNHSNEMSYHSSPLTPPLQWQQSAEKVINSSREWLLKDRAKQLLLQSQRGLTLDTVKRNKIGWNPVRILDLRENWGLEKFKKRGQDKKLFIPPGIVIPTYVNSILQKVKIRRSDWYMGASFPKYHIIAGSKNHVSIFGNISNPIAVIVEAELDAILVSQEAGDPFCAVALGGASIRPDLITHQWLRTKKLILFSLDFDEAGKHAYAAYWKKVYPNLKPWPTPFEKSPGDAFQRGLDLKEWLQIGIG